MSSSPPEVSSDPKFTPYSKLMQNYIAEAPVAASFSTWVSLDVNGEPLIVTIGKGTEVICIREDAKSDTGWSRDPTKLFTAGNVCTAIVDGELTVLASNGLTLDFVTKHPQTGRWSVPVSLPSSRAIVWAKTGTVGSDVYLVFFFKGAFPGVYGAAVGLWEGVYTDLDSFAICPLNLTADFSAELYNADGEPALAAPVTPPGQNTQLYVYEVLKQSFWQVPHLSPVPMVTMVAAPANGLPPQEAPPAFFGIGTDGYLYYLRPGAPWQLADGENHYALVSGTVANKGQVEAYGILGEQRGATGSLVHVRFDQESGSWTSPVPLKGGSNCAIVVAISDASDNAFAFDVRNDGRLFRSFQDPSSTTWVTDEIAFGDTDRIVQIWTYTTEVTLTTADGGPLFTPVLVWSDDLTQARVNNQACILGPTSQQTFLPDGSSKLTIEVAVTGLYAPVLRMRVDSMEPGESISIQPNAEIQQILMSVTPETLTDELGVPADKAERAAPSIAQVMSLTSQPPPDPPSFRYLAHNRSLTGLRHHAVPPPPAHLLQRSAAGNQNWIIHFEAEGPRLQILTADEASAWFASHSTALPTISLDDIGDALEYVGEKGYEYGKIAVHETEKGIEAGITFFMDGVEYTGNFVITTIGEAYDVATFIFDSIDVAFEEIVDWLGFVFDWGDILRTKDAMAHLIQQSLGVIGPCSQYLKENAEAAVSRLKEEMGANIDSVLQNVLGEDETMIGLGPRDPAPDLQGSLAGTNIVLSGLQANGDAAKPRAPLNLSDPLPDEVKALIAYFDNLGSAEGPIRTNPAFGEASDYFKSMIDNPDRMLSAAFAGVLRAFQGMMDCALDFAHVLLDKVFDALAALGECVRAVLEQVWDIPFVSSLYSTVISPGNDLTALDLVSLIIAIPTTVTFKTVTGKAPFVDADALDEFKRTFTTEWILGKTGLQMPATLPIRAVVPVDSARSSWELVFGCLNFVSTFVYGICNYNLDVKAIPNPDRDPLLGDDNLPPHSWCVTALVLEWSMWITSLPWITNADDDTGLGCHGYGFVNTVWVTGIVTPLCDVASYRYTLEQSHLKGDLEERVAIMRNASRASAIVDWVLCAGSLGLTIGVAATGTQSWMSNLGGIAVAGAALPRIGRLYPLITEDGLVAIALFDAALTILGSPFDLANALVSGTQSSNANARAPLGAQPRAPLA